MAEKTENGTKAESLGFNVLHSEIKARAVHPGVHILGGMGNSIAIETDLGFVVIDTGMDKNMAGGFLKALQGISDAPVHTIVYSHGHGGYNAAVWVFLENARKKGIPAPQIVAHENLPIRYHRYEETWALQNYLAAIQFRIPPEFLNQKPVYTYPTMTFRDKLHLNMGNRPVEVLWAPSETNDAVAVWLPADKLLYGGPAVISSCINIGTPLRTQRDDVRWVNTLEKLAALQPEIVIPSFGTIVKGRDEIQFMLSNMAEGLRYLRREVVKRINMRMTDVEIIHDMDYPAEYFEQPWSAPVYGCPDMIVRDIYRSENGWWDRNPTNLHPAHPHDAAKAVLDAISDRKAVLDKARKLMEEGQAQLALHVIDILALAPVNDEEVKEARRLKSKLLHQVSGNVPSLVSTNLYLSHADFLDKESEGA